MDLQNINFDGVFKFLDELVFGTRNISYLVGYLFGILPPVFLYGLLISIITCCVCAIIRAVTI